MPLQPIPDGSIVLQLNTGWIGMDLSCHKASCVKVEEQFPPTFVHPKPNEIESYPIIEMESIRSYSLRCDPLGGARADWSEPQRVAVEKETDWIKGYPKIEGDVLSDEQIAMACGKVSSV